MACGEAKESLAIIMSIYGINARVACNLRGELVHTDSTMHLVVQLCLPLASLWPDLTGLTPMRNTSF